MTPASPFRWFSWVAGCALVACAGAKTQHSLPPTAATRSAPAAAATRPPPRFLPQNATFADVVDVARALDAAAHTQGTEGCLIGMQPSARLAADVLLATRPIPDPPRELATSLMKAAGPPTVLTAWGSSPGELPEIALSAFTTTTPASAKLPAIGLFLTEGGVFVRGAAFELRAKPGVMPLSAAETLITRVADPAAVYVTAEAGVPLARLAEALRSVPNRFEVALAVALPKGTRLPGPPARSTELLCPEGLPAPADDEPEGSLEAAALREIVAPLREAALSCALSTGGVALQGGRLELGLRIGIDGRPREVCLVRDAVGELALRRCIIEAARGLRFPAPRPAGFVDLQLPLELAFEGPSAQRAVCD